MKKYLNKWIAIITTLVMAVSLTACGASSSGSGSSGGNGKVLVAFSSDGDTFRDALRAGVENALSENGVEYESVLADDSVEVQIDQIKKAKEEGYSAVICRLVSSDTAAQVEKAAGDMPIIYVNNAPSAKFLEADKYVYVGSEEAVAGQYEAEYVLEKLSSKDSLNVMVFKGEKGHSATAGRTSAAKATLEASGKQINYIFEDYANWSEDQAREYFSLCYKTGVKPDAVICNNDSMAVGVVKALKDNKISTKDVVVCGVDAITDACELVKSGDMDFTVCQNAQNQAIAAVDAAVLLMKGTSLSEYDKTADNGYEVWVDFEKVDASNVADYL